MPRGKARAVSPPGAASPIADGREHPEEDQITRSVEDHADYVAGVREAQSSKQGEVREGGIAAALGPWDDALDDMPQEALMELLSSMVATHSGIEGLQLQEVQHAESVGENSVTGEDASDRVQGPQPPAGDAVAVDDDDAEWMNQLVDDLKMNPDPPSRNAAAHAGSYINVGGDVMERDAYDFIRYDLGMPPPNLEPQPPDYGEQQRLWSCDDSSFPQSAPPHSPTPK